MSTPNSAAIVLDPSKLGKESHVSENVKPSDTTFNDHIETEELHVSSNPLNEKTAARHCADVAEVAELDVLAEEAVTQLKKDISENATKQGSALIRKKTTQQALLLELLRKHVSSNPPKYCKVKRVQEEFQKMYVNEMRKKILKRNDFLKTLASMHLFREILNKRAEQDDSKEVIQEQDEKNEEAKLIVADSKTILIEDGFYETKLEEMNLAFPDKQLDEETSIHASCREEQAKGKEELVGQDHAPEDDHTEITLQENVSTTIVAENPLLPFGQEQLIECEKKLEAAIESEELTIIAQPSKAVKTKKKEIAETSLVKNQSTTVDHSKQFKREKEVKLIYDRSIAKKEASEYPKNERRAAIQVCLQRECEEQQKPYLIDSKARNMQEEKFPTKWDVIKRYQNNDATNQKQENHEVLVKNHDHEVKLKKGVLINDDRVVGKKRKGGAHRVHFNEQPD